MLMPEADFERSRRQKSIKLDGYWGELLAMVLQAPGSWRRLRFALSCWGDLLELSASIVARAIDSYHAFNGGSGVDISRSSSGRSQKSL